MSFPLFQVDSFTSRPFRGNPAGVCLLDKPVPASWMQNVAAEMNLSETAFLLPEKTGLRLRWFTPRVEVKLCGHATLAAAHVLTATAAGFGSAIGSGPRPGLAPREVDRARFPVPAGQACSAVLEEADRGHAQEQNAFRGEEPGRHPRRIRR